MVVVDRLSKRSHFVPCHSTLSAAGAARLFYQHVWKLHGLPSSVLSDRGTQFVAEFTREIYRLLDIKLANSTAYHPQTDGQTERCNQELELYLRTFSNERQNDWARLLPLAEFAYNNTPQSTTGVSPFFANKGYHLSIKVNVEQVSSCKAAQMAEELSDLHAHLREQLRITITAYEQATDNDRLAIPPFRVGEYVWLDACNIHTTNLRRNSTTAAWVPTRSSKRYRPTPAALGSLWISQQSTTSSTSRSWSPQPPTHSLGSSPNHQPLSSSTNKRNGKSPLS